MAEYIEYIEYIIISVVIITIVFFQRKVFLEVQNNIKTLKYLFPKIKNLSIESEKIDQYSDLTYDKVQANGDVSKGFHEILDSTNSYLKNNKGSAADVKIIKDITQRQIATLENKIEDLECKISMQDDAIQELKDFIIDNSEEGYAQAQADNFIEELRY